MTQSFSARKPLSANQLGIGLPAAIFVITLMSLIAAAVFSLVNQNAQTYSEEISLARAFYAAESGASFAMNTVFPPEDYPTYVSAIMPAPPRCGITTTYTFVAEGLNQCTAEVACTSIVNGGNTYATIQSKGSCGDVERTVRIRTVY